jgi:hypothetical protein
MAVTDSGSRDIPILLGEGNARLRLRPTSGRIGRARNCRSVRG